jgi:hypothetical protein
MRLVSFPSVVVDGLVPRRSSVGGSKYAAEHPPQCLVAVTHPLSHKIMKLVLCLAQPDSEAMSQAKPSKAMKTAS